MSLQTTKTMTWGLRLLLLASVGSAATGCSREGAARRTFSEQYTCPKDRVTATKVEGVTWGDLQRRATPPPAAEIQADPGRLALWEKEQARLANNMRGFELYRATGCGHEVDYGCFCPSLGCSHVRSTGSHACVCIPPPTPLPGQ